MTSSRITNASLAFLRQIGAEFAGKYPKIASRLALEADKM